MQFDKIIPINTLKPYIKYFLVSATAVEKIYKVLPSTGMVIGFQYQGKLSHIHNGTETGLSTAGVTGISDRFKIFKNTAGTGTILVYFTEMGLAQFTSCPANELFNQSISLDNIFSQEAVREVEERLALAKTSRQRISVVEQFLLTLLRKIRDDRLIVEAVKLIYQSNGAMKISALAAQLFISKSPFEKRFRKLVGASPKKFASIVRFNTVLHQLDGNKSLTDICYENNFFDQAHFIKDFKLFTGSTPQNFQRPQ
jgi:AraC-like DNA-binding protein